MTMVIRAPSCDLTTNVSSSSLLVLYELGDPLMGASVLPQPLGWSVLDLGWSVLDFVLWLQQSIAWIA